MANGSKPKPGTHNRRVYDLLSDGKPHTHHELYDLHVVGHSRISDLRRDFDCEIAQWHTKHGYCYQLIGSGGIRDADGPGTDDSPGSAVASSTTPPARNISQSPTGEGTAPPDPPRGAVPLFVLPHAYDRDAA